MNKVELARLKYRRKEIQKQLEASEAIAHALQKEQDQGIKKIGLKGMEKLGRKLRREHKAFCIKRFGKVIWGQTNNGWFQSYLRWESKHYNGYVTISVIDLKGKVRHKVVPYNSVF